ncbi:ketopantoate reductase family protein [Ponticoccus sp. SC2-23]|uniref:ketopantoate reductase family protein n=1 Tax=Alexandriicola marinus TaxID=2081710 RepID=UPI000FD9364A|nr:2-dehydropantoate 2-reductase N-terminal domain-containing protein [Alexandriicola marinus]MBM1221286.1 ketopantoate reductase family protein [Ponticoccus sp. SC6-9]MBM1225856.1 ketopantoate reductase family protein [Ponticoccus sp. SC6-15]MBM1228008.1 ketopantoate reductase family protein [Ponticoccus sp. SC6-38]MBM1234354.1 ketopantoate reductase family protein [Ponticoccus sp. SC6-45]MBM1238510.1 ketopantoate reductase family protein [Ponticoccus sp. SC6-49]MBM1243779.1 ketopantoate red
MTNDEEILIWGAGAIGGTIGAYWARAGIPVRMVDIVAEHAQCCSGPGLRIEGPVEAFTQVVPCVTPDNLTGRYRRIVLAVKAQATEEAMAAALPHLAEDGYVVSAQNGLNERVIAAMAGPDRTMGAFVNFGADWQEPGRILFGNRGAVVVGEIDGTIRDRTREMHRLMQVFEPDAVLTDDIWAYLWGKMGYGAMLFATALTNDSMTANFADPTRGPALIGLAREVMATAAAEGVTPRAFNGFEPAAFVPGASPEAAHACLAQLAEFNSRTAKTHTGVWRDLAVRKRRTEVDAQVGAVARIAHGHGIAVPLLDRLVELIHDIEDGRRDLSPDSFAALMERLT